jgi:hypothetical protein
LDGTVLALFAVESDVARGNRCGGEVLDERALGGIEQPSVLPPGLERGRDAMPGAERDLPLGGSATGEYGDDGHPESDR